MSVSGVSSATLQNLLQSLNSGTSNSSSNSTSGLSSSLLGALAATNVSASDSASASTSNSPAYVLSSSQKQAESQLLGYSNLGKLISNTESALKGVISQNNLGQAVDGNGKALTTNVTVSVSQLATGQTLASSSFGSADSAVFGTGTLTLTGSTGASKDLTITDGSLNGVASAINGSGTGVNAYVVQNTDGSYQLQLTGPTGAANAFSLSGIPDLAFDPSTGAGTLQQTVAPHDALYSVNGGAQQSSASNDSVTVAPGVTTSFTATGSQSIATSLGQTQSTQSVNSFIADINAMISGLPSDQQASASTSSSTTIGGVLAKLAGQSYTVGNSQKTLADIGITVGSDGSLTLDQAAYQTAYSADPSAVTGLVNQVAQSINNALSQKGGASDVVQSSLKSMVSQMVHVPTLADYMSSSGLSA